MSVSRYSQDYTIENATNKKLSCAESNKSLRSRKKKAILKVYK